MISGTHQRRGRALLWSALASAALHVIILTLVFYAVARLFIVRGAKERVSETQTITITQAVHPTATPAPRRVERVVRQTASAPARVPPPELAKRVNVAATPQTRQRSTLPTKIERDQAGFAKEVAQLNQQDNPNAIPTIDPGQRESPTKTYAFNVSSSQGDQHGNGIITPTRRWRADGRDCYYGQYEYTYPDGAQEYGDIVWPFCYDPALDPFKLPPHQIPFPFPLPGYKLPPDTQLPPIEKSVYDEWASQPGASAP